MKKESEEAIQAETGDEQRIEDAILVIAENQLKENKPPETKITLDRLMAAGESRESAMKCIAGVLSNEIFEMMKDNVTFNEYRYTENLKALPKS